MTRPTSKALSAASVALDDAALQYRDLAEEAARKPDHPRYQAPEDEASDYRQRADLIEEVARWLESLAEQKST